MARKMKAVQVPELGAAFIDEQAVSLDERAMAEIESRAYEIYQARGGVHGHDLDDWLQAEREFKEAQS